MSERYNTPDAGTLNWHVPLNENFKNLGTDVEIRDDDANKSNYDPAVGAKFFANDTKKVYLGDGSQWNYIGDIAKLPGDVVVSDTEPSSASVGDIWIETSSTN
ncbi:hypothetical protein [Haloferax larsenii]|uniref:Major tropism determinant N-terminal domain-containing protein n=1 Tax=Haloferax larsenii TaxID=302484 RepID=A0A1H7PUV2_HALLR|nr:hypothetical protein [Haloferax larsenii]ELZ80494.1 hypothetical protein C455_06471 [Haloferax larsenii JCM 13917]SEL38827.1 hypothetical protein SAMN04488691_104189 [Haloferax larsenii]